MADQAYSFDQVKTRLEDIVGQVKRKDITLEQSLELLEESVRLANTCNELVDQVTVTPLVVEDAGSIDEASLTAATDPSEIADSGEASPESAAEAETDAPDEA